MDLAPGKSRTFGRLEYGVVEIRAKLPDTYGFMTYAKVGDIDIFRSYSGVTKDLYLGGIKMTVNFDPSDMYHLYTLESTSEGVRWYIDGEPQGERGSVINGESELKIGNEWYKQYPTGAAGTLHVDYVRIWAR